MLEKIIGAAVSADSKQFHTLVADVASLQGQERSSGAIGDSAVEGSMVRISKKRKLILVGDLHGDLQTLASILKNSKFLDDSSSMLVFLGDYGDRGGESVEVYHVVLSLKARFSDRVILLRGNHEGPSDLSFVPHDLPAMINEKFGSSGGAIYQQLRTLFDLLHHAVLVESSYLVLHGGVPVSFESINDIANAHATHPRLKHLEEILWNDPRDTTGSSPSPRGYGKFFGKDVTEKALKVTNTSAVIRAHEVCNGYKINHDGLVLTIFSCKAPYGNAEASYLVLNDSDYNLDGYELAKKVELI